MRGGNKILRNIKYVILLLFIFISYFTVFPLNAKPVYTNGDLSDRTITDEDISELFNKTFAFWKSIGISPKYLSLNCRDYGIKDEYCAAASKRNSANLKSAYNEIKKMCEKELTCDNLLNNGDSNIYILIENTFFKNHTIYRVTEKSGEEETFIYYMYDYVFSADKKKGDTSLLFFYSNQNNSTGDSYFSTDQTTEYYNKIIDGEPELKISRDNLLEYVGFYLYLTSKNPGDYIINSLDDYESHCEMVLLCYGVKEAVDKIRKQTGEIQPTKIEPVQYNGVNAWQVTIHTATYCGCFESRTLTVLENGKVYQNSKERLNKEPYMQRCGL